MFSKSMFWGRAVLNNLTHLEDSLYVKYVYLLSLFWNTAFCCKRLALLFCRLVDDDGAGRGVDGGDHVVRLFSLPRRLGGSLKRSGSVLESVWSSDHACSVGQDVLQFLLHRTEVGSVGVKFANRSILVLDWSEIDFYHFSAPLMSFDIG